ncbi:hypothetical protein BDY17DRAFT_298760 [Neohortaea acidophila]|uniref:Uncharacterized protein n=1 Tax=Neohortaea acidophila TaxID=245834 RepID=A0A6A6PSD8_9PEZI|nr:uncharacterized protein BDY17DRAFT_298760 [Neohortaea acidophila]KAF2482584.1 hypothetical protein BDY17DRAFT_298760 [Neohortaea acidophila]
MPMLPIRHTPQTITPRKFCFRILLPPENWPALHSSTNVRPPAPPWLRPGAQVRRGEKNSLTNFPSLDSWLRGGRVRGCG